MSLLSKKKTEYKDSKLVNEEIRVPPPGAHSLDQITDVGSLRQCGVCGLCLITQDESGAGQSTHSLLECSFSTCRVLGSWEIQW